MDINTKSKLKVYITSKTEMNRRKRAFATLLISTFLSMCIFAIDIILSMPKILVPSLIIFAIILIMLVVCFNNTLDKQSYLQVHLSESELERNFKNSSEKYSLNSIETIQIKRTTKGLIREIGIAISGMKSVYINGLENFEEFVDNLISINKNVEIKKIREPIDYDHPLFYMILGTIVGIVLTLIFRLAPFLNEDNIKYAQFLIACFIMCLGIFWSINKPITGRYGKKKIITDYIWGAALLLIGILILISSKIFW